MHTASCGRQSCSADAHTGELPKLQVPCTRAAYAPCARPSQNHSPVQSCEAQRQASTSTISLDHPPRPSASGISLDRKPRP